MVVGGGGGGGGGWRLAKRLLQGTGRGPPGKGVRLSGPLWSLATLDQSKTARDQLGGRLQATGEAVSSMDDTAIFHAPGHVRHTPLSCLSGGTDEAISWLDP